MSDNSLQTNFKIQSVKSPKVMAKDAEIKWALKVVLSHFSYRSCLGTNKHFKITFSDSALVKEFSMSKTKCAYVIHFGMAPIFKNAFQLLPIQNIRQLLRIKKIKKKEISSRDKQVKLEAMDRLTMLTIK